MPDTGQWSLDSAARKELAESAGLTFGRAPLSCHSADGRVSCDWYHGVYQYLRLFNMVVTPDGNREFYRTWLREALSRRIDRRVVVTGAADYSMLSYVIGNSPSPDRLSIHVVDRCPTPLEVCRRYADKMSISVALSELDLLTDDLLEKLPEDPGSGPRRSGFDVVVTDALLTRFAVGDAYRVVRSWKALLGRDGVVVTTIRVRNGRDNLSATGAGDLATRFVQLFDDRIRTSGLAAAVDSIALLKAADVFARRIRSTDLGDVGDVMAMFEVAGLSVRHCEVNQVDNGPTTTAYACIVAGHKVVGGGGLEGAAR